MTADILTAENMGPFWVGIPILSGGMCLIMAAYLLFSSNRHTTLALSLVAWSIFSQTVSSNTSFVSTTHWDLSNWMGIVASLTMQGTPIFAFYSAMKKPSFRSFIYSIPAVDFTTLMVCRIAGVAYLYLYITDTIRNFSTLQLGLFDLIMAVTALPMASYVKSVGLRNAKGLLWKWHAFGLADLVIPFFLFPFNVVGVWYTPAESLSMLYCDPIAIVVWFNVPLSMCMHYVFLTKYDELVAIEEQKRKK